MLRNYSVLRITFTGTPPLFQHSLAQVPIIHFDPPRSEAWKTSPTGLTWTPNAHHRKAEWASLPSDRLRRGARRSCCEQKLAYERCANQPNDGLQMLFQKGNNLKCSKTEGLFTSLGEILRDF